jgi:hypothetical protein
MRIARPIAGGTLRSVERVLLSAAVLLPGATGIAQGGDEDATPPRPTILILQELASEAAREVAPAVPGDTAAAVVLTVEPAENTWFVDAGFATGLAPHAVTREPGQGAGHTVAVGITGMGAAYENVRRDGLFGERIVTRTVLFEADVTVTSRVTGEVVHRTAVKRSRRDDVGVDDLERLESPGLVWTTGTVPSEGFFSSVLEPVITIGAIAVAVILLFTVRS